MEMDLSGDPLQQMGQVRGGTSGTLAVGIVMVSGIASSRLRLEWCVVLYI